MRSSIVADVVIFTKRAELTKLATEHCKLKGVSNVLTPPDADEVIDALNRFPKALLLIDWELGAEHVVKVLSYNRRRFHALRPVLLVAPKVSEQVVATAAEYGVSQIFAEALTLKNLGARLANLIIAESMPDEIKRTLVEVADKRVGGDLKGAYASLSRLLLKHPTNLRLRCETAEALMALGEPEKAMKLVEGMDKTKPPYLRGIHLQGRCLMKLGRFAEALAALEQANLFNPHEVERLVDLGQALLNMDRIKDANASFEKALALDPDMRTARLGTGECKLMEGNVNQALEILREVSGDLEMASIFNTCAVLNMRKGRHEAGMHLYTSALGALGKDERLQARLYFNMGIGYRRWGKKDKAQTCFESAQKLDPGFAKVKEQIEALKQKTVDKPQAFPGKTPEERAQAAFGLAESTGIDLTTDLTSLLDEDLEESLWEKTQKDKDESA